MDLYRINLNLMVAFAALIKEKHVSNAAKQLHITQSAMSKLLNQCRAIFQDQVLVRTAHGMEPTERALSLYPHILDVLQRTENILSRDQDFNCKSHEQTVRIGMPDSIADFVLPKLIEHINLVAPNFKFNIINLDSKLAEKYLANDEIQLAITYGFTLPASCMTTNLIKDRPVCMARSGHELMQLKSIPIKKFLEQEHIALVYEKGSTLLGDRYLAEHGYPHRKIKLTVSNALTTLPIIAKTDLIITIGELFAKQFSSIFNLDYRPLPPEAPDIPIQLLWSPIYDSCVWHVWLRNFIKDLTF